MNPTPPLSLRRTRRLGIATLMVLGGGLWLFKSAPSPEEGRKAGHHSPAPSPTRSSGPASGNAAALQALAPAEQESLWTALDTARRSITPLTESEAALPGNEGVSFFSYHPGQEIAARYTSEGVRFSIGRDDRQAGFEYDDAGAPSELTTAGIRAELRHGDGVTEWFENRQEGIEHGFTLSRRPASAGHVIQLDVKLSGLHALATDTPGTLELHSPDGGPQLKYSGLKAWDADGKDLLASMTPTPDGIRLAVDDRGARYPLTVDPLITNLEQELEPEVTGPGEAGDRFGISVATDGTTAVIGADSDDSPRGTDVGRAYVFSRVAGKWLLKAPLAARSGTSGDAFGRAVAISGTTILVGAPLDDFPARVDAGSASVFVPSGNSWVEQATFSPEDRQSGDHFGEFLSLSGTTAAVGTIERDKQRGAVYVYFRSGSNWPLQQRIFPPDSARSAVFGRAISVDGNNLAVGARVAPGGSTNGAVYLYTRSSGFWTERTPLVPTAVPDENFGVAVALSGTGLLVGADRGGEIAPGAAYFFTSAEGVWTQRMRITSGSAGPDGFGRTVALTANAALAGAAKISVNTGGGLRKGAVYFFNRQGNFLTKSATLGPLGTDVAGETVPVAAGVEFALAGWTGSSTEAGESSGTADVFEKHGAGWSRVAGLSAGDNAIRNRFGYSVDIDGDTCAVGAATDTTATGSERGSTYVFIRHGTTWAQQAKLSPAGTQDGILFGTAVALSGDTLIAGAPGGEGGGTAYAYFRGGGHWELQQELDPGGSSSVSSFGASVALDENSAVIGAPNGGEAQGSAHVFVRSDAQWSLQATLEESPPRVFAHFGNSVAIDGATVLVGAPAAELNQGIAHVFTRDGTAWLHQASLNGAADLRFGTAVSLSGDHALVGAPGPEDLAEPVPATGAGTGAAHLFARSGDTWHPITRFTPENPEAIHRFGLAVDIDGSIALVGAGERQPGDPGSNGAAYVFAREGTAWTRQDVIGGNSRASFASALALSGDTVIAAASTQYSVNAFDQTPTPDTGHVSIFRLAGSLLSGPEASLLIAFDEDGSGSLSAPEWLGIYVKPPAAGKEKLFTKVDTDASGDVSLAEFIAAKSVPALARTLDGWISRAAVFLKVDEIPDGIVTRGEVAAMWTPGTPEARINAFWSRAKGGAGLDLKEWITTKTLPNFSTYEAAEETREQRAEVAATLDTDDDGEISYAEFAELFNRGNKQAIRAAWRAATGTRRFSPLPAAITIGDFIEAPKLPKLPAT